MTAMEGEEIGRSEEAKVLPSGMREDQINNAVSFLLHPKVKDAGECTSSLERWQHQSEPYLKCALGIVSFAQRSRRRQPS